MTRLRPTARQLEYFVTIAETSSFNRAARNLDVSQPTVSHQIGSLEQLLGLKLFERSRGGAVLTVAGRELLPNAWKIMEELQGLSDRATSITQGPTGTYRLGVSPTLGPYLLPHVLPTLRGRYNALRLAVREDAPQELEEGLLSGKYDVILTELPVDNERFTVAPIFREPLKLVLPVDHRLAGGGRIDGRELAGESVLTIDEQHRLHYHVANFCSRIGLQISREFEGTSLDSLRNMVAMGLGIAFLPVLYIRSKIHRCDEFYVAPLGGETIERTHALAWRATSPSAHLFGQIAEEIRSVVTRDFGDDLEPAAVSFT